MEGGYGGEKGLPYVVLWKGAGRELQNYRRDGFRHGRDSEGPRRGVSESPKAAPISRKALLGLEEAERPVGKSQQPEVSQQALMGCL